ncbi:MAG TPA: hypothetical protein VFY07_06800, partial [Geomobilimonas sp.]|nr:hypothetical protein [Geomobilimonas sp.]
MNSGVAIISSSPFDGLDDNAEPGAGLTEQLPKMPKIPSPAFLLFLEVYTVCCPGIVLEKFDFVEREVNPL